MTTRTRRVFDTNLKLEVIRMIKEQGQSVQNVSETMGIGPTAIRRWLTQYSTCNGWRLKPAVLAFDAVFGSN